MVLQNQNLIKPLAYTSKSYMDAHLNFRKNLTNQGDKILKFLQNKLSEHIRDTGCQTYNLASIGSGAGIIDSPLVGAIQRECPVNYLGIEPNLHENEKAKEEMMRVISDGSEADFFSGCIEELSHSSMHSAFDAIIAVHVTYYARDIAPMLEKAFSMLNTESGCIFAVVSANTIQNELFMHVTHAMYGYVPFLANQYKQFLDAKGYRYKEEVIKAEIDLTDFCADPDSQSSIIFLNFFLHCDSSSMSNSDRNSCIDIIIDQTVEKNGRSILPHIAEAVTCCFS